MTISGGKTLGQGQTYSLGTPRAGVAAKGSVDWMLELGNQCSHLVEQILMGLSIVGGPRSREFGRTTRRASSEVCQAKQEEGTGMRCPVARYNFVHVWHSITEIA